MGWETVQLADVKVEKPQAVPAGRYVFTLQPGAAYRQNPYNNIQELNVRFDVTEGEFAGRPIFVSYPDPTAIAKDKVDPVTGVVTPGKPMTWSAQALKKLELALGQDSLPGEDTAAYLNRVALNGNARITAPLLAGKFYTDKKTGEKKPEDPKFGIFDVAPAA
jgi:hypothetical protein